MVYKREEDVQRLSISGWIVPANQDTAVKHDQERSALKTAISTRALFICALKRLDNIVQKPFKSMTKQDLLAFMSKRADQKSNAERKCLKIFFQWLYDLPKGRYPPCIEWLTFNGNHKQKLPEEMLTKADILALIQASKLTRDKALIFLMYDTGARAGEIAGLQIKHVKFDHSVRSTRPDGEIVEWTPIYLRGKTGERIVYIQDSIPSLKQWISEHPTPNKPDAPIFPSIKNPGKPLDGANVIGQIVKRAKRHAGITKRVHPHIFRHSRATSLAQSMTEQELKQWFGWTGGSHMPATYTHLNAGNLLEKLKKTAGVSLPSHEENPLGSKTCLVCKTINIVGTSFCKQCGNPLNLEVALAEKERDRKRAEFLDRLMSMSDKDDKWGKVKKEVFG